MSHHFLDLSDSIGYWGSLALARQIQPLIPQDLLIIDTDDVWHTLKITPLKTLVVEKQNNLQNLSIFQRILIEYPTLQGVLVSDNWQSEELMAIMHCEQNILCYTPHKLAQELNKKHTVIAPFSSSLKEIETELQVRNEQFEELYQLFLEQQKKLDTLVNHSPVIMFALDTAGRFTLSEGQSLERLDAQPGELLGHSIYDPGSSYKMLIPHFERVRNGGTAQFTFVSHDIYLETLLYPIYNLERKIESVAGICLDVTSQKRTEKELEKALKQAKEASKAKTAYLANMSHEIRTPLNAILGFAQILKRQAKLPKAQQSHLQGIILGGEHLLKLINNVLELAKIEANKIKLKPIFFDIRQFFHNLETIYRPQFEEKDLDFEVILSTELPQILRADEAALRQVIVNLLGNALKFTFKGHVHMMVTHTFVSESASSKLNVEIKDTGIGISPDTIKDIFNAFQQSRGGEQAKDSTGLGLAISKRIVQLMKGSLTVSSVPDQGTSFTLSIPATWSYRRTSLVHDLQGEIIALAPLQSECRVLVVDDQETNRQVLSELLTMVGFQVKTVSEGKEALRVFSQWLPAAVLLDRRMPGMDGLEVTRAIRALPGGSQVHITMISASAFAEELQDIYTEQIDAFLSKPFQAEQIYQLLGNQLNLEYITTANAKVIEELPAVSLLRALMELPNIFLEDFKKSVLNSDLDEMLTLISHIACETTRHTLKDWANAFEYEKIMELIETGQSRKNKEFKG